MRYADRPKQPHLLKSPLRPPFAMFNWISQIAAITFANLKTLPERRGAAIAAAVGIAGVVTVLVGVLSIAEGFRRAMTISGSPDVAIVLRSGSDSEMTSGLTREDTRTIADAPGLARDAEGPLASAELFVIITLPKRSTGTDANVPLRGVSPAAFSVRGNIEMLAGRRFGLGRNEVIVGAGAARQFAGLDLGKNIRVGQNEWTVVGIFTAKGGVAESEIWTDAAVLQPAYHRGDTFQGVYARLTSSSAFREFSGALTTNPRLSVKVVRQSDFYAEQSTSVTSFISGIGVVIAGLMALGALFGALNTMYSSVSARTREIATLRALGFGSGPVVISILLESLALALIGGVAGAVLAYFAFDGFTTSTMNWQTFSQVAFAFQVSPALLIRAITWSAFLGLFGGLFPAIHAARLPIATALRAT
jgi:putative ABC transport system permease protein